MAHPGKFPGGLTDAKHLHLDYVTYSVVAGRTLSLNRSVTYGTYIEQRNIGPVSVKYRAGSRRISGGRR